LVVNTKLVQTGNAAAGSAATVKAATRNVDLPDGRTVKSSSEEYRRHCEAKFALSLPDKSDKRRKGWQAISKKEYLERVRDRRGEQAAKELRDEMMQLWKSGFRASPR
jgi:hypothetical protein